MTPRTPITGEEVADDILFVQAEDGSAVPGYLTAGKLYEAFSADAGGFDIIDDSGDCIYCLWQHCAHLDGGNWIRTAATAARQQGEGK